MMNDLNRWKWRVHTALRVWYDRMNRLRLAELLSEILFFPLGLAEQSDKTCVQYSYCLHYLLPLLLPSQMK